jgi:spore germination protein YaaH
MREAVRRGAQAGAAIQWDERASVPFYRIGARTIYFENERSLMHKLAVQARAGLAGIAPWRLGHEVPEVWDAISRAQIGQAP